MIEKAAGVIGLIMFILFAGYLTVKIGEVDLWIVFIVVAAMAIYDFYLDIFKGSNDSSV